MDGDQFIPPPPPPEEPQRRGTGLRKIAATALVCAGLLVGSGVGGFAIAHAAGNATPSGTATTLAASTTTPSATKTPSTKTPCPNMGGSSSTSG